MINKRYITKDLYALSNENGDIAFGNKSLISYMRNCKEKKEIKEYAKENKLRTQWFREIDFFLVSCSFYTKEKTLKQDFYDNN
jgi:hypothetical protein